MAGKIFINYRRGDDPGHTGRLFDRLQDAFDPAQLFLDVDNIAPGLDFVGVLNERVAECDVLLAIIGKGWIDARNAAGLRRLDDPDDFVRIEIASALNQGKRVIPVLVGEAQMPRPDELPEEIRLLARRNAVRLTHERFRADVQGLVKALQKTLEEINALHLAQVEATRNAQAEEERRRQEEETARRVAEQERRERAEVEARERAAAQHRRREAAAKQRAEEERALATAKHANTVAAIDLFLLAYPTSHVADEVRILRAALVLRAEAHQRALASDDPTVLGSFLATYERGVDADQVRRRLRFLQPQRRWQPLRPATIIPVGLALMLIVALVSWIESEPRPNAQQGFTPSTQSGPPIVVGAQTPQAAPEMKAKAPYAAPVSSPDEVTWTLLKDTTDESALKLFMSQYPKSPMRKDAEARITALKAEQAATVDATAREQSALKAQSAQQPEAAARLEAARKELEAERAKLAAQTQQSSNQQLTLANPTDSQQAGAVPSANVRDSADIVRLLKNHLQEVGCNPGDLGGEWTKAARDALNEFNKYAGTHFDLSTANLETLEGVRQRNGRICPLACAPGMRGDGDHCVAITCKNGFSVGSDGKCQPVKPGHKTAKTKSDDNVGKTTSPTRSTSSSSGGAADLLYKCRSNDRAACQSLCSMGFDGSCRRMNRINR